LFIQEGEKLKGREITLTGSPDSGWIKRDIVEALEVKRDTLGLIMVLTLPDTRTFNVMFDQSKGLDTRPVLNHSSFTVDEDFIINSIKLLEV